MNTADVLYQGWDIGMREAGDVASHAHSQSSHGFTAINQCSSQPRSPCQASAVSQTQSRSPKAPSAGKSTRGRNPTVASYLGLGDSKEPAHLIKYAPTPDSHPLPPQPTRKRRVPRNGERTSTRKKPYTDNPKVSSQTRVSETLRITKPSTQSTGHKLDGSDNELLPTPAATAQIAERRPQGHDGQTSQSVTMEYSTAPPIKTSDSHAATLLGNDDEDDDLGQLCFDFDINTRDADSSPRSTHTSEQKEYPQAQLDDDDFDDDLMDGDLLDLTTDTTGDPSSPQFESSSPVQLHIVDEPLQHMRTPDTSASTSVVLNEEGSNSSHPPKKFVSPVTLTTRLLAATGDEARKPIVRRPFPTAVCDRSPIIGLSSSTLLRSCFRIGEAISQSCHAAKAGNNILVELYARVLSSERDDLQQRFTFCDLFHAKPPYIQATYAAAIWKTAQLFEYDSGRLLQQGRICRCIGTMKRNGKVWVMAVLNVWEATWDDVQWVEGIVNS